MNARNVGRAIVLGLAMAAGSGAVLADGSLYERLRQMKVMDTNKDGMVSKAEFMKMVEMAYDEKAKQMGMKGGKMTQAQLEEMVKALFYTGG
jgi:Ca2+-binding EF-hand superfamily protein